MTAVRQTANETVGERRPARLNFTTWPPRTASLVAGTALALMAVLAGLGNFGAIVPLVTPGNAVKTAQDISESGSLFLAGIGSLFVVTILDLIVAGALYALFRSVSPVLSAVAAWARVVFAGVFMVAIGQLVNAYTLLDHPVASLRSIEAFTAIWVTGLGVFGIHLLLVGYLAYRSGFMARIFGILLAVAGLGYLADAVGTVLVPGFTAVFGQFLFVGEVALIFWLLIRGRRLPWRAE
ncbi:DUF4386 domain-containing protein [Cryobacterium algoritolerans]|uniref:DUF4386 domain-containing protein n=1 Tax=Cryobacterium algoritolerans TaxID=1259184 RepID=A0A4R8WLQ6_9MICO|nr:DUF4386 domain-containing protein [Cryobacterium algoritolerans]TFC10370.1 DUF4386 domain-containing protein [Cryobacterium algoritolerans]